MHVFRALKPLEELALPGAVCLLLVKSRISVHTQVVHVNVYDVLLHVAILVTFGALPAKGLETFHLGFSMYIE